MKMAWKAVGAAFAVSGIIMLVGVMFFFRPIAEAEPGYMLVPPALVAFLVYVGLGVALFDWAARQMHSAWKGAFIVAAAQYLLVIDLTLRGERDVVTALASGVLLTATWTATAFVYARFMKRSIA